MPKHEYFKRAEKHVAEHAKWYPSYILGGECGGIWKVIVNGESCQGQYCSGLVEMVFQAICRQEYEKAESARWLSYRVYACGRVVFEDDFEEEDNAQPHYDDYGEYTIPIELYDYIADGG